MQYEILTPEDGRWLALLDELPHDIYHHPAYCAIEARRTHSNAEAIVVRDDSRDELLFLPYLKRSCKAWTDDDTAIYDAISPYGYAGPLYRWREEGNFLPRAFDLLYEVLREQRICTAFLRLHPLLNAHLARYLPGEAWHDNGKTVCIDLTQSSEALWKDTRPTVRNLIGRCRKMGMQVGMENLAEQAEAFRALYYATMDKVQASQSYYFDAAYFTELAALSDFVHLAVVRYEGRMQAAGIFFECRGIVQYHLSGATQEFAALSPTRLLLDFARSWAKERGNRVMHLGGGFGGGEDSLLLFKSGFSKWLQPFATCRIVLDSERFERFNRKQAARLAVEPSKLQSVGFFPPYRCQNLPSH